MKTPRQWYRFDNQASDPSIVDVYVLDVIGDWTDDLINQFWGIQATVTAKAFVSQLSGLDAGVKTIRVHYNTPGGDVFAAQTMASALRDQVATKGRSVESYMDGLCASAGTIMAMAGQKVFMSDNALMMIHQPAAGVYGNAKDLRSSADTLDTITKTIVAAYQWHSAMTSDEIVALLEAETWMDADAAIASGFATDKVAGLKAAASIDFKATGLLKVPEKYRDRVQAFFQPGPTLKTPATALQILAACKGAGFLDRAEHFVSLGYALDDVTAELAAASAERDTAANAATQARATADQRAADIRALCGMAKLPARAELYIRSTLTLDDVRADLTGLRAQLDAIEINNSIKPDGKPIASGVDVLESYARLNTGAKE